MVEKVFRKIVTYAPNQIFIVVIGIKLSPLRTGSKICYRFWGEIRLSKIWFAADTKLIRYIEVCKILMNKSDCPKYRAGENSFHCNCRTNNNHISKFFEMDRSWNP